MRFSHLLLLVSGATLLAIATGISFLKKKSPFAKAAGIGFIILASLLAGRVISDLIAVR